MDWSMRAAHQNFGPYWSRLDRALGPLGFTGFHLSTLSGQNLAQLETTMASANPVFTEVVEKREWATIRQRLGYLYPGAQFIALRPKGNDLDIVLGRQPSRIDIGKEKEYAQGVSNILSGMYEAAETLSLTSEAESTIEQLSKTAATAASSYPPLAAAITGARLVLPFIRFHGCFRCVVVVDAQNVNQSTAQAWWAACLRDLHLNAFRNVLRAGVQSWLWDVNTDNVSDTNWTCQLHKGMWYVRRAEIPNLETAEKLTQLFITGMT